MATTKLSTAMKIARLQAEKTLVMQAKEMGTSPSFISAMEHGHKNISDDWSHKIQQYFSELNIELPNFSELVAINNKSISLHNIQPENISLLARLSICFTNSELKQKDKEELAKLIDGLEMKLKEK